MKNLRRKRLVELLNSPRFGGDRSAFLASAGVSKGRLTQLLNEKEPFGDAAARNLCESLSLPDGWFDAAPKDKPVADSKPGPMSLEDTLAGLCEHLSRVDPLTRKAAGGVLMALAQQPDSLNILDSLTALMRPVPPRERG